MLIEPPNSRITKEDAAAAIRLEAVLVGVNNDGVGFADPGKRLGCVPAEIRREFEVAAVRRVHMHSEAVTGRGSTAPRAVVPRVTTTVPALPVRSFCSSTSTSMRPEESAATLSKGSLSTLLMREWVRAIRTGVPASIVPAS